MLYIHQTTCISPQTTFGQPSIDDLHESLDNKLKVIEPAYSSIPPGLLRRMGKAVRIGVGAAMPLLQQSPSPEGIIIGTANGGMEDCIKFLNQIIEYEEGLLAPGNFVQSTSNAIASTIGLLTTNRNYNNTHVHRGLAFENALLDVVMLVKENPSGHYLLGAVDEISSYNYNIDYLDGWYKKEPFSSNHLYTIDSPGSIAGEGAVMFLVNGNKINATAAVQSVYTLHTADENLVKDQLKVFIEDNLGGIEKIDLLISGENGDNRLLKYYETCENSLSGNVDIVRFKHMSGEFPTASAIALWLAGYLLRAQHVPEHMVKRKSGKKEYKKILIYNNYKGIQHSFILISKVEAS